MHLPSEIELLLPSPKLSDVVLTATIPDKKTYFAELALWQKRLLHVQQAYYRQKKRAIIVFEGWDAGGKGGAIRRVTEKLDPRGYNVYPISAPTEDEKSRHYLYRFQNKLPIGGTITIFDRSYYGRVLVERVEGFAKKTQWQRAYQEINEFERMLGDDDIRIIKIFLHIDKKEQLKRFEERLNNPVKRWKLTEEDLRNRNKWSAYEEATQDMFKHTTTKAHPWTLIAGNHKWFARVQVLKSIVEAMEDGVDITVPKLNADVIRLAKEHLGVSIKNS